VQQVTRVSVGLALLCVGVGCRQLSDKSLADLTHEDPVVRARAAALLGNLNRRDAVPGLIARLDDEAAAVRSMSALSLRKISGRHFGYNPRDSASARTAGMARWQQWWERETSASPGSPAGRPGAGDAAPTTRPGLDTRAPASRASGGTGAAPR